MNKGHGTPGSSVALDPHRHPGRPVPRQAANRAADLPKTGATKQRLGAEVCEVIMDAPPTRPRIGLHRWSAFSGGVRHGLANEGDRDSLPAGRATDCDAGDDPDVHAVHAGRRLRGIHPPELTARSDGHPSHRLAIAVGEKTGCPPLPPGEALHPSASPGRRPARPGKRPLLTRCHSGIDAPAAAPPGAAEDATEIVHAGAGERMNPQAFRHVPRYRPRGSPGKIWSSPATISRTMMFMAVE